MRADLLLEHFDTLVRTPGDVAVLKATILDLAMHGRLIPQDLNDEPVAELLKRIKAEKQRLCGEKKIRSLKSMPPLMEDEEPYELPRTWIWVRLGEVTNYGVADEIKPSEVSKGTWVVDLGDIEKQTSRLLERVRVEDRPFKSTKTMFRLGDVLYGKLRPYLDKVIVADEDGICSSEIVPIRGYTGIDPYFLRYALKRPDFIDYVNSKTYGVKMPRLGTTDAQMALIPLPPLAEQKRIVNRVDELLAQTRELSSRLEETDLVFIPAARAAFHALAEPPCPVPASSGVPQPSSDAWQRIADTFDSFAGDPRILDLLKQTILQLAVQGQLVPQDSNDEPASALLERIQAEKVAAMGEAQIHGAKRLIGIKPRGGSVPLPQKWEWCRLADVTLNIHYGYTASADYSLKNFRMLRITDIQDNKVDWESVPGCEIEDEVAQKYLLRDGDILIARTGGTIGKTYLVRDLSVKAVFASYLIRVISALNIDSQYLKFFLESPSYWGQLARHSKGTGQPNVNATSLSGLVLPLPPLAEQQRIVAKVEQLSGLCDALAAEAAAAETVRTRLLAAVVNGG